MLKTSYSSEIPIEWNDIAIISTDSALHIVLDNETSVRGTITPSENGRLKVTAEKALEPVTFDLSHVFLYAKDSTLLFNTTGTGTMLLLKA